MEEALNRLKNIGAEDIAKKTHITVAKIEAILAKDFANLDRVGAVGFIHILEREYKLDLTFWIEQYDEFYAQNGIEKKETELKANFITQKEETEKESSSSIKLFIVLFLIAILVALFYFFTDRAQLEGIKNSFTSFVSKDEDVVPQEPSMEKIEKEEVLTIEEEKILETGRVIEDQLLVVSTPIDVNETNTTKESNITAIVPPQEISSADENRSEVLSRDIKLIPQGKLWLGIIDVDKKSKKTATIDKAYDINGTDTLIILTGHGNFKIVEGDGEKLFSGINPIRLKVEGDSIKQITLEEFKELNGGSGW